MIDNFTAAHAYWAIVSANLTQKQKFDRLRGKQNPTKNMQEAKLVINLTNKPLEPAAASNLGKGLNYAQTTCLKPNFNDIVNGVEQAIQNFPIDSAEEIRQDITNIIRHW
jgi:tRNA(His) 5'-end guanylyltransferase